MFETEVTPGRTPSAVSLTGRQLHKLCDLYGERTDNGPFTIRQLGTDEGHGPITIADENDGIAFAVNPDGDAIRINPDMVADHMVFDVAAIASLAEDWGWG